MTLLYKPNLGVDQMFDRNEGESIRISVKGDRGG